MMKINKMEINYHRKLALLFFFSTVFYTTVIKSQSLREIQEVAKQKNSDLQSQYLLAITKQKEINLAKVWDDPSLGLGYFISPIETRLGPQIARFSLSQKIPLFGINKSKEAVVTHLAEAENHTLLDKKKSLDLSIAKYYYHLHTAREIAKKVTTQVNLLKDLKKIVESYYNNNKASLTNILMLELKIEEQKSTHLVLLEQEKMLIAHINQLLNRDLDTPINTISPNLSSVLDKSYSAVSKIDNHPQILKVKSLLKSAEAKTKLSKKENLPKLGIGLHYTILQDKNVPAIDAGQDAVMPVINLSIPIFKKKNTTRVQQTEIQKKYYETVLTSKYKDMQKEIEILLHQKKEYTIKNNMHKKQIKNIEDILTVSYTALSSAKTSVEEIIQLEQTKLTHQIALLKAQLQLHIIEHTLLYYI